MGVAGLWDILRPAGETRSLTHLSVVDGFECNPDGVRGFRIGIDASIWFYHAAYGREGENPELRTLFFKCTRLMSAPFLPLFVFDGPKRPEMKRGKRISGKNHWMIQGMQQIISAFGFEWRMAPGEAEAELAFLNRIGMIDAVYTDDVDTFLFGAKMIVRNPSVTLSGNRAHSLKNSAGKDDGNHVATYTAENILRHPLVQLTQGGLILIGILRGGDYHQAGLTGCGGTIAHGLAKCGFGDTLLQAARTRTRDELPTFLHSWREEVRAELRTNSRGLIGKKYPSLAKSIPDDFPNIDVLLSYTNPVISEGSKSKHKAIDWEKEPDLGKIAALCELYFEWGVKEIIIKRFRTVLWPAAVLRILRRAVLLKDKETTRRLSTIVEPTTPQKAGKINSPSRNHGIDSDDEDGGERDPLIVKIYSSRQHASTDGVLEYRLEIAPAQLVRLCEAGVKGLRTAVETGLVDEDEDGDDSDKGTKKGKKPPPDPQSHLRIWLPACMVRIAEPDLVEEFEGIQEMRGARKARKAASKGAEKGKATKGTASKKGTGKKLALTSTDDEESDTSVSPQPIERTKINRPMNKSASLLTEDPHVNAQLTPSLSATMKGHFRTGKSTRLPATKATASKSLKRLPSSPHESPHRPHNRLHTSLAVSDSQIVELSSGSEDDELRVKSPHPLRPSSFTSSSRTSSGASASSTAPSSVWSVPGCGLSAPPEDIPRTTRVFVPAPFPMSFEDNLLSRSSESDNDGPHVSPPRPDSSSKRTVSQQRNRSLSPAPRNSSPDLSLRRSPYRTHKKSLSPSADSRIQSAHDPPKTYSATTRANPSKSKLDMSIIEISSDSESEPRSTAQVLPPLLQARAKTSTGLPLNRARIHAKAQKDNPHEVVNLT